MGVTDKIKARVALPPNRDPESKNNDSIVQTTAALSRGILNSIKAKGGAEQDIGKIIASMTVKDINDLLFDDDVPEAPGRRYYHIIEAFLSSSSSYADDFPLIIDGYSSVVSLLQERIQELIISGVARDEDTNNRLSTASYLEARLTSICERTKLLESIRREFDKVQNQFSNMSDLILKDGGLNSKVQKIDDKIANLNDVITGREDNGVKTPGIKEKVDALGKKVDETKITSDQIMPNIISLMGVFSSIIVVILSLITTSSTWLSTANETDVLVAFIVPAGIITLAICALTALVRASVDPQSNKTATQPNGAKSWPAASMLSARRFLQKWGLWLIIVIATIAIVWNTANFCKSTNDGQVHYLIKCQPSSESIDNSNNEETQTPPETPAQELFIVQEVILPTGERHHKKIPCAESDIHSDGFVYYCLLHQCFE